MALTILYTVLLTAFSVLSGERVAPAGLACDQEGNCWMSVTVNPASPAATLSVYRLDIAADTLTPSDRPLLCIAEPGQSVIGGALHRDAQGRLLLFYTLTAGKYDGEGQVWMRICDQPVSAPGQWSEAVRVGSGCVTAPPVELKDGTLVLATALWGPYCIDEAYQNAHPEWDARRGSLVFRSTDAGKNWKDCGVSIQVPERRTAAFNNPKLFVEKDGSIGMVLRSFDSGFAYLCRSADGGKTWNVPSPFFLNPDHDPAVCTLSGGRLLLVKNFKLDYVQYLPARELFAYLSDDDGISWYPYMRVTTDDYAESPLATELPSSEVLVAWSHQQPGSSEVKMARLPAVVPSSAPLEARSTVLFEADGARAAFERHCRAQMTPHTVPCPKTVRLATWNIQREGWGPGPKWTERRDNVFAEFQEHAWDIVGTQEASIGYVKEIIAATGDIYDWVANVPEFYGEAARSGSEQPILYRKDRFTLLACGPLEYSQNRKRYVGTLMTGDSYGIDYYKATTWAKFHDKENDIDFYLYNIHMPVRSDAAQAAQALVLREDILTRCEGLPVLLTGDFNCQEDSWCYHYLTELPYLQDTMTSVTDPLHSEYDSWCDYTGQLLATNLHHDHIFYTPFSVKVQDWEMDIETIHEGKHSSDHLPITINFTFYK